MSQRSTKVIEKIWQTRTEAGNDLFQTGQLSEALTLYLDALHQAEWLVDHAPGGKLPDIPVMHLFIISCNNLSNTYLEMQETGLAEAMLRRVIYFLLYKISLQQEETECQHELRKAFVGYVSFCRKHRIGDPNALFNEVKNQSFSFTV